MACMKKNAWKASYVSIDIPDYYQNYERYETTPIQRPTNISTPENESSFYIPKRYQHLPSSSIVPLPPSYSETFPSKDIKPKLISEPRKCIEKLMDKSTRAPGYARLINETDLSYQEKYTYSKPLVPSSSSNWKPSPLPLY
uniref:Testicular haploid expressed protein n=1 Tax=Acrobeloides nanus TaxID=290746 RepID=A0A914E789_9BILA